MYEKIDKSKENKSRAVANSVAQKKIHGKSGFGFVDNRSNMSLQRKNIGKLDVASSIITQFVRHKRTIENVLFNKSSYVLFELIKQQCPANVYVVVTEMDHASSRFKVVFSRENETIDEDTAQGWVDKALIHKDDDSSSK